MPSIHRSVAASLVACASIFLLTTVVSAQPPAPKPAEPDTYVVWRTNRVKAFVAASQAIPENGNGIASQKEAPSADSASTSLVDTSAASDFVSMALSLTGLQPTDPDDTKPKSGSITVTAYSLAAGIKGVALIDPKFYKNATNWRRLMLTIGSEASKPEEVFTDKPSTNLGGKFLIINDRDVYSKSALAHLTTLDNAAGDFAQMELKALNVLECIIFRAATDRPMTEPCAPTDAAFLEFLGTSPFDETHWKVTRAKLEKNAEARAAADTVLQEIAAGKKAALDKVAAAVEQIQKARQLSIAYFTKLRQDEGTDEHRVELIFDYGLSERLNWTANGSFDHKDRKKSDSKDSDSYRLATEFQAKLTSPGSEMWSTTPVLIAGAAETSKESGADWLIRAQVKVTVPVSAGINIPVAYTYASRASEGIEKGSAFKFSLSIDPVRLRERLR